MSTLTKPPTGQATFTAYILGNHRIEFSFDWVQRSFDHGNLLNEAIEYDEIPFKEASVRAGIPGADRQTIIFEDTGESITLRDGCRYAALITGDADSTRNPRIVVVAPIQEFEQAKVHREELQKKKTEGPATVHIPYNSVFLVNCLGNEKRGTLLEIMRHFTMLWKEDPTKTLAEDGKWKIKKGTIYVDTDSCPPLPPLNNMTLHAAKALQDNPE